VETFSPEQQHFWNFLELILQAGVDKNQIEFVELVGEATRIPTCQAKIKDVFGKEPMRTLNSQDCIARGCALQAAMLSPNFQVADFTIEEFNQEPVAITYRFKNQDKVSTKPIFKVGSNFPSTKSITFENKMGNLELLVAYEDSANILPGLPRQIAQYDISEATKGEKTEKCAFTMRVSNNIHNVPQLDEVEFVQEWTEEEKIPVKTQPSPAPKKDEGQAKEGETAEEKKEEPVPEEIKYETKQRVKKNFSKIPFSVKNFSLAPSAKQDFKDFEAKLMDRDMNILETKRLRNSLEAYSYEMRNNLDSYGSWEKYLDEQTKASFLAEINKVVDWIYGDGEHAPKQEYEKFLNQFMKIGEPVKQRYFYYSELDVYFNQFDSLVAGIMQKEESLAHLTEEQKGKVAKSLEDARGFMDKVRADRDAKALHQDPAFKLD
jgi:heat shock protein 4